MNEAKLILKDLRAFLSEAELIIKKKCILKKYEYVTKLNQ